MKFAAKSVLFLAAAASAAVLADPASASGRHKKSVRARSTVAADAASSAAGSRLVIGMVDASNDKWELRMDLRRAPTGLAPEGWFADASGTLSLGGTFAVVNRRGTEYRLRLRGRRGDALPAGAATLTELGGRAFEVRDAGVVVFSGDLPSLGSSATTAASGGGADDPASHDANDDHGGSASGGGSTSGGTASGGSDDPANHDVGDDHGGSGGSGGSGGHGGDDGSGHR